MWEIVRNLMIGFVSLYALYKVGPPTVENFFLPTIENIAGTFHAIAPVTPPATTFAHMPLPMAASSVSVVFKTAVPQKAAVATISMPEGATITGSNQSQWASTAFQTPSDSANEGTRSDCSPPYDGPIDEFFCLFEWCSHVIRDAGYSLILHLRQLIDSFLFQVSLLTALLISLQLYRQRKQINANKITALQDQETMRFQQGLVKDLELEVESLKAEITSQKVQLEQATNDEQTARHELRDARLQVGKQKEKISELEKQLTDLTKQTSGLETEISRKDATIESMDREQQNLIKNEKEIRAERDKAQKDEKTAKSKDKRLIADLQAQISSANNLHEAAKAQVSNLEALVAEAAQRRRAAEEAAVQLESRVRDAEERALQAEARAAEAAQQQRAAEETAARLESHVHGAEERALQAEARAAEAAEKLAAKEKELAAHKADSDSSIQYLRRQLDIATFQEAVDDEPSDTRQGPSQYHKSKLRSNKRDDGSIYTSKHPRYDTRRQQSVGEQEVAGDQAAIGVQRDPETHPDIAQQESVGDIPFPDPASQATEHKTTSSKPKQERRLCTFFQQGACKFKAKCHNIHELDTSVETPPEVQEEAIDRTPTPTPAHQADDKDEAQPSRSQRPRPVCKFYRLGYCKYGRKCRDLHPMDGNGGVGK